MNKKKLGLTVFLAIISSMFALVLGNIDFYGLFGDRQSFNIMLILASVVLIYFITITVFLFDFSDRKHVIKLFSGIAIFFTVFFFLTSGNVFKTLLSGVFFFIFLDYVYSSSLNRSRKFISFQPNDIFLPVVKNGFFLLVILFAILSFVETQSFMTSNKQLSPLLLKLISKPIVGIINKQLGSQINKQIDVVKTQQPVILSRQQITRLVLAKMVTSMDPERTKQLIFGITPSQIHVEKAIVKENGDIDLTPVVDDLIPAISNNINTKYGNYVVFTPFIIAFLVILLLQSSLWPFSIVAGLITPVIFYAFLSLGLIKKVKERAEIEKIVL